MNAAIKSQPRHAERGNAGLIAIIFIGFATLTIMTLMAANGQRETRNLEKANSKLREKWQARSALNILAGVVARDAPVQMDNDVQWAQRECGVSPDLPLFDGEEVSLSHAAVIFTFSNRKCNRENEAPPTSIFGTLGSWRDARIPLFQETGQTTFGLDRDKAKVLQMDELYRRTVNGGSGVAYVARYIVEAKIGNYRTRASNELIFGVNAPACGTSVTLEAVPPSVERGQRVELRVTYASANRLQIFNSVNTLIHEEAVTQQAAPATFVFRFTPAITETYHVIASGSGGCQARSAGVSVTVNNPPPPPACPTINFFTASSTRVTPGSTITLSWNVSDAAEVRLDGNLVSAVGTQNVVINAGVTTFILIASGPSGSCPRTATVRVEASLVGPCPIPIIQFSANPTSVLPNESVTLSWNVTDLRPGAVITLTGPGLSQTVAASGTLPVTPPPNPGTYTYRLHVDQPCGTDAEQSLTVTVTNSCPPPVIDAFVATPDNVLLGFAGTVNLSWTISGTADVVSISNGVGGALPASGNVDIPAPVVDTVYTITTIGCGQTRTAQVLVRVTAPPPPPPPQPVRSLRAVWRDVIGFTPFGGFGVSISDGYTVDNILNVAEDGRVTGLLNVSFTKGWDTRIVPTVPEATNISGAVEIFDAANVSLGVVSFSHNCPPPAPGPGGINICRAQVALDFTPSVPAASAQPVRAVVTFAPTGLVFNSQTVNGAGLPAIFRAPIHFGCPLVTETFTDAPFSLDFLMNKVGPNTYEFAGGSSVSGVTGITDANGFTVNLVDSGQITTPQELASGTATFTLDLGNGPVTRTGNIANCP